MHPYFLAILCSVLSFQAWAGSPSAPQEVVVLVPGFFSSFAQPYFSTEIVTLIRARGVAVEVLDNLNPVGTLEDNGQQVQADLRQIVQKYSHPSLTIIGHSLGGLYTLLALHLDPKLPVKSVVTLSTPYEGVGIVDGIQQKLPGLAELAGYFDLESLAELRTEVIQRVLRKVALPKSVRWIALGGYQKRCLSLSCALPERLSWVMSIGQFFIGRISSDGIVTYQSATAQATALKVERWDDFVIPLEHWEMVLDHRVFRMIGVWDTDWIWDRQKELYTTILNRLSGA